MVSAGQKVNGSVLTGNGTSDDRHKEKDSSAEEEWEDWKKSTCQVTLRVK